MTAPAEAAAVPGGRYFEGDLVACDERLMVVLGSDEAAGSAECVWYAQGRRLVEVIPHARLQLLSASVLRPGYRLVQPPAALNASPPAAAD
jgi:hypothetical protein